MKGAIVPAEAGLNKTVIDLLKGAVEKECFDVFLMPVKVPAGDSFAYVLIQDESLLEDASPLPPIMPVQGAKAISSITRIGKGKMKIAAAMRPCEIRATIELSKLGQVNLDNVVLISIDCPGVLPLADFLGDPYKGTERFNKAIRLWDSESMREVCKMCVHGSMVAGDLHIGTLGAKNGTLFIMPNTEKGRDILDKLGLKTEAAAESWQSKVSEIAAQRQSIMNQVKDELKSNVFGLDNLAETFSQCINCHNCMRVCPICYCQQCYFESDNVKHTSEDYLQRAEASGSLRFVPDTLFFHIGRMLHMSISCVSCGTCEDACPMSIPVARIFSVISQESQALFDYLPGKSMDEPRPLTTFREEEFQEIGE